MKSATGSRVQNFHVPLPHGVYRLLRKEAERAKRPATEIAREAIEACLEQRRREALQQAIGRWAADHAGTAVDLDRTLERSGAAHLVDAVEESE